MEKRRFLLSVILVSNFVVLFLSFTGVTSAPVTSIMTMMKNDPKLCEASRFLCNSTYVRKCTNVPYLNDSIPSFDMEVGIFLCSGVYDTMYKICQYSSQQLIPTNISVSFDSYMKERAILDKKDHGAEFCEDLKGYSCFHNKTEPFQTLVKNINVPDICMKVCFDLKDKVHPLCVVLDWIKSIDEYTSIEKYTKKVETGHGSVASATRVSNDETISDDKKVTTGGKPLLEAKETKEQVSKAAVTGGDNVKTDKSNATDDASSAAATLDAEKNKSGSMKQSKDDIPKKKVNKMVTQSQKSLISSTTEQKKNTGVSGEVTKHAKNTPANDDSQIMSVKNPTGKAADKDVENQENVQEYKKPHDIEDVKTSTISENTQEHYDMNPDEDVDSNRGDNMDDVDDTIPQSIGIGKEALSEGNQNDISQEVSGQKDNLQYSNARIEDESHFFTYFTVITVVCIVGYFGYHNKQKILAIVLEGRRSRSSRSRRRPSTASYRKLDCTLEEAVTSQCNANVTHVIY